MPPNSVVGLDALGEAAPAARPLLCHHVGEQHGEGLVADDLAGAPDRVAEAERRLLAGEAGRPGGRQVGHQGRVFGALAAPLQRVLELVGRIEMILDDALVAAGDENEMLDPRLARLVDDVLQDRPVDDGQHLLGDRLGRRQEAGAEAGDGKHGLADRFFHRMSSAAGVEDRAGRNLLSLSRSGGGIPCGIWPEAALEKRKEGQT